ncbi:hypothetical protein HDU97_002099 [Phlyctochytrium planicorne]|nr:hypothetical protein HDU97_002099 [Phlyctochytrium planicorne]
MNDYFSDPLSFLVTENIDKPQPQLSIFDLCTSASTIDYLQMAQASTSTLNSMNPNTPAFAPIALAAETEFSRQKSFLESPPQNQSNIPHPSNPQQTLTPNMSTLAPINILPRLGSFPIVTPKPTFRAAPMTPVSVPRTRTSTDDTITDLMVTTNTTSHDEKQGWQKVQYRLEGASLLLAAAAMLSSDSDRDSDSYLSDPLESASEDEDDVDEDEEYALNDDTFDLNEIESAGLDETLLTAFSSSSMGTPMHVEESDEDDSDDEEEEEGDNDDDDDTDFTQSTYFPSSFSAPSPTINIPTIFPTHTPTHTPTTANPAPQHLLTQALLALTTPTTRNPRKRTSSAITTSSPTPTHILSIPSTPPNTPGKISIPVCSTELAKKLNAFVARKHFKTSHEWGTPLVSSI